MHAVDIKLGSAGAKNAAQASKSACVRWDLVDVIYAAQNNLQIIFVFYLQSIRGQTFNLLYVDEANFIKKDSLPAILGFMLQKDAKIIFISSVNTADKSTSFLFNLKNAQEKLLNVVTYVCPSHRDDISLQESLVACPCYRLYTPTFISVNESIKSTTNLFLEGAFTTELMGDAASVADSAYRVITNTAINQFDLCRIDTTVLNDKLENIIYMYIDPAYTNNTDAAGTGIAAVIAFKDRARGCVLVGLEHFFLRTLTGAAAVEIASCASATLDALYLLHPEVQCAYVAIEGNSSQDSAVAIATVLNQKTSKPIYFSVYTDRQSELQWPIYILTTEKHIAFEQFIYALNSSKLRASQTVVSRTVKLSYDPITYLIQQINGIKCVPMRDGGYTYSAKKSKCSDDVLIAAVMAYYFCATQNGSFKMFNL